MRDANRSHASYGAAYDETQGARALHMQCASEIATHSCIARACLALDLGSGIPYCESVHILVVCTFLLAVLKKKGGIIYVCIRRRQQGAATKIINRINDTCLIIQERNTKYNDRFFTYVLMSMPFIFCTKYRTNICSTFNINWRVFNYNSAKTLILCIFFCLKLFQISLIFSYSITVIILFR